MPNNDDANIDNDNANGNDFFILFLLQFVQLYKYRYNVQIGNEIEVEKIFINEANDNGEVEEEEGEEDGIIFIKVGKRRRMKKWNTFDCRRTEAIDGRLVLFG